MILLLLLACDPPEPHAIRCWNAKDETIYVGICEGAVRTYRYTKSAKWYCGALIIETDGDCLVEPLQPVLADVEAAR